MNAEPSADLLDTAAQHGPGAQFTAFMSEVGLRALAVGERSAIDNTQAADFRKLAAQRLGHAAGKAYFGTFLAAAFQRQHDDARLLQRDGRSGFVSRGFADAASFSGMVEQQKSQPSQYQERQGCPGQKAPSPFHPLVRSTVHARGSLLLPREDDA